MTHHTDAEQLHQLLELVLTELDRKAIPIAYMQEIDRKGKAFIEQAARRAPAAPVPQGWKLVPDDANMTDEQAEAICAVAKVCGGGAYDIYRAALAAAPQPPEHTSSEHSKPMCGAAPKVDPIAWYVTGCSTMLDEHDAKAEAKRCGGCAQAVPLYTEPQPPEAQASVSNGTFAAPVQLPEPVYTMRVRGRMHDYTPTLSAFDLADGEHALYTEQQVRQLLANHGIQERST